MRDKRGYVPTDWMDEMPPMQGEHPDAFLERTDAGLVLRALAEDEIGEMPVRDGQLVQFSWHEDRGSRIATVRAPGDFDLDEPFAPDTNCFRDAAGSMEVENDLAEMIRYLVTDGGEADDGFPVEIEVEGWTWQEEWYRLTILESGAGHFERVEPMGEAAARARIDTERKRQIEVEHFSPERDRVLCAGGQLYAAALCYLSYSEWAAPAGWPWDARWWKPGTLQRNLERGGALLMAEIDRAGSAEGEIARRQEAAAEAELQLAIRRLAELPA